MKDMEQIKLSEERGESKIIIGNKFLAVKTLIPDSSVFIITDSNVALHYLVDFPKFPTYIIEPGEGSKNLEVVSNVSRWLLEEGADRSSFLLGIGGGVVCDLAGFVASTYMRGIDFAFVATTLMAQVDASIGGKNGVNLDGYKNIVGTFNQPKFVLCPDEMLRTLPREEYTNGFAEIVKHSLIADREMFEYLEQNADGLKAYYPSVINHLVKRSVEIKASIVQADEHERGERKILNFGHTWGHAVEKVTGLSHGMSVSIGIEFAARLSVARGLLENRDYKRIINLLRELNLPICFKENPMRIFEALTKDKKKTMNHIDFIMLKGIGKVSIERLPFDEIRSFIEEK